MSVSVSVKALAGKESPEFKKHLKAVIFCIENNLSYPKETSEFFKGKCGGDNLEDIKKECVLEYIQDGVEVPLKKTGSSHEGTIRIQVADIPKEADEIVITLSY